MAKDKKPKVITKKQFDSWSADKQQRALADKKVRQRIETKALPAEWRARREQAQWNKTEISPGSGVTYGDVEKTRKYNETLTFGEGDRQLADRYQNLADARQRDADWFTAYRNQVAEAQQRAIGAQQAAVAGNQQLIQSATDASNNSRDAIVKQLQDRAAQLGQSSQAPEYQQLADAATSARNAAMVNTGQRQLADAASAVRSATTGVDVAGVKDLEAQGYRNRQQANLEKDTRDYVAKRGAWRQKFLEDAIASARKAVLEDKAFGLKQSELKLKGKQAEAQNALAQARLDIQKGNLDIAAARLGLSQQELAAKIAAGYFDKSKSSKSKTDKGGFKSSNPQKRFEHGLSWLGSQTISQGQFGSRPIRKSDLKAGGSGGGPSFWIDKLRTQGLSNTLAHRVVYSYLHGYRGSYKKAPKRYEG